MTTPYEAVFAQRGDRYHRAMQRAPEARAAELGRAVELAGLRPGERVADIPSGGGYLRPLLPPGVELVEVETAAGFSPTGAVRCASLTAIPLPDASFDRVLCVAAAHHVADEAGLYAELRRLLRPGGRLVLADGDASSRVARFLDGFVDRHTALGHVGRFLSGAGERLAAAGFRVVHDAVEPVPWRFASVAEMTAFCADLFGVDCEPALLTEALRAQIGVEGSTLNWELRWILAEKPTGEG